MRILLIFTLLIASVMTFFGQDKVSDPERQVMGRITVDNDIDMQRGLPQSSAARARCAASAAATPSVGRAKAHCGCAWRCTRAWPSVLRRW